MQDLDLNTINKMMQTAFNTSANHTFSSSNISFAELNAIKVKYKNIIRWF